MFDGPLPENLPGWPQVTARAILDHCVEVEVSAYRDRQEGSDFLLLDLPALRKGLRQGSVGFGSRDLEVPEVDLQFTFRAAAEAVKDGAVLMFVDDELIGDLEIGLKLQFSRFQRVLESP